MRRIHPEYLDSGLSDRSLAADALLRQGPEEGEDKEDEGEDNEDADDDNENNAGCSE